MSNATQAAEILTLFSQDGVDLDPVMAQMIAWREESRSDKAPSVSPAGLMSYDNESPTGPDPAAPATHQAWEEVVDARLAVQHLESKAQEYAAGLFEPEDITPADRRDMRLYLIAARACLTQAERLFGLA